MIDMHTHLLTNADNGCKDFNDAGKIILQAKAQGITHMILTPHQKDFVGFTNKELIEKFENFKRIFEKRGIELFLGAEIEYSNDTLIKVFFKRLLTLNNSNFVLLDFLNTQEEYDMIDVVKKFKEKNFKVIIAHIECYTDLSFKYIEELKNAGAYLQVDAETIFNKKFEKWIKVMLKERYIDFIASNIHSSNQEYLMKKAFFEVAKRTNDDYADLIFKRNQKKILIG